MEGGYGDGHCVRKTRLKYLIAPTGWSYILKQDPTAIILDAVHRNQQAVTRAYALVKLLLLEEVENLGSGATAQDMVNCWPEDIFTSGFFQHALTAVSQKQTCGAKPAEKTSRDVLEKAFELFSTRGHLPVEKVDGRNMSYVFANSATEMVTAYKNNVHCHYFQYFKRFMNQLLESFDAKRLKVKKTSQLSSADQKALRSAWRVVKDDIIYKRPQLECQAIYRPLVSQWADLISPRRPAKAAADWNILDKLFSHPTEYLAHMVIMNRQLENLNSHIFSPLCLRRAMIPCHIRLDTQVLVDLLVPDKEVVASIKEAIEGTTVEQASLSETSTAKWSLPNLKTTTNIRGAVNKLVDECDMADFKSDPRLPAMFRTAIWRAICQLDTSTHNQTRIQGGKMFNNIIDTDGYSASLHYVTAEGYGATRFNKLDTRKKKFKKEKAEKTQDEFSDLFSLEDDDKQKLLDENATLLLAGDPGKSYLITLTDGERFLAYSSQQRRAESSAIKNASAHERRLKQPVGRDTADTFKDLQNRLCQGNSKSCMYSQFAEYLVARWAVEERLSRLYKRLEYRRAKYRVFCGITSSETRFFNLVEKTFLPEGDSRKVCIAWGDWGASTNLKNSMPTPGLGFRRRCPFQTFTNREAGSSKVCFTCNHYGMENPKVRAAKKSREITDQLTLRKPSHRSHVHSLLRCPNEECASRWWNRDPMASLTARPIKNGTLSGHVLGHGSGNLNADKLLQEQPPD